MTERLPEVLTMEGDCEIKEFMEYDGRELAEDEVQSLKEADIFYKTHCEE